MNAFPVGGIDLHALLEWHDAINGEEQRAVDRLAASLFVGSQCPGTRLMAMFTAYFDAAGNAIEQPFVVVSGYIANYLQWRLFEESWKTVHKEHGVELPFHMTEFIAAVSRPEYQKQKHARQDYIQLAKDSKRANEFLKNLCVTECCLINCAVSCIVPMDMYDGVSSLLDLREVVPPYALAARTCIKAIHDWEREFHIEEPVECIFEEGDFEQGKFTDLMIDEGMDVPIYKKKDQYAGLQAADHYAWEQFLFLKKELRHIHLPARNSFKVLLNAIPKIHIQPTTATLINLCQAKRIDPKTGKRK